MFRYCSDIFLNSIRIPNQMFSNYRNLFSKKYSSLQVLENTFNAVLPIFSIRFVRPRNTTNHEKLKSIKTIKNQPKKITEFDKKFREKQFQPLIQNILFNILFTRLIFTETRLGYQFSTCVLTSPLVKYLTWSSRSRILSVTR